MITQRDISYVGKLAPVAQLLEMLGHLDQPGVRSPEVFLSMSREIWAAYLFLSARLNDEMLGGTGENTSEHYFSQLEQRVRENLD
ncbi:hypothetical protein [Fundidesulfovibrio terrae]|uniref:hypothetical protein n=1 Tax=Fundidesulfovibrio terrae TaxID=2922866 RepID=UPI001FAE8262|nr:hypothetical protein [Fundidesulfovibrio terrae]